jgi:hypothetical protein
VALVAYFAFAEARAEVMNALHVNNAVVEAADIAVFVVVVPVAVLVAEIVARVVFVVFVVFVLRRSLLMLLRLWLWLLSKRRS